MQGKRFCIAKKSLEQFFSFFFFFLLDARTKFAYNKPVTETNNKQNKERTNTMTKVTNLAEYNIAEENVKGFLNSYLYTDCESYLVYEKAGHLFAVRVERDGFKPEWVNGYCVNNDEQCHCPVKIAAWGKHLDLEKKRGFYGFTDIAYSGGIWTTKDRSIIGQTHGNFLIVAYGDNAVRYAELTPTGKLKTRFIKLAAKIEAVATQFHDNNF